MTTRERPGYRGRRRGERILDDILRDFRQGRLERNLTQAEIGRAIGLSDSQVSLIEAGGHRSVSLVTLAAMLSCVGLDLSARAYPAGNGLRDAAQLVLLQRLHDRVGPRFRWRPEFPMPIAGDLRAWDVALLNGDLQIGIDAETRLRDIQAVDRRVMLKFRDSGFSRCGLLVADTRINRRAILDAGEGLRANYPIGTRTALRSLAAGEDPGGHCLIVL